MTSEDEWEALPSVVGVPLPEEDEDAPSAHADEDPKAETKGADVVVHGVALQDPEAEETETAQPEPAPALRPLAPPPPALLPGRISGRGPASPNQWRSAPAPAAAAKAPAPQLPIPKADAAEIPAAKADAMETPEPERSSLAAFDALLDDDALEEGLGGMQPSVGDGLAKRLSLSDMELVEDDAGPRISLSDMELVEDDAGPRISLSDIKLVLDAPPPPPPATGAKPPATHAPVTGAKPPATPPPSRTSLVDLDELLVDAARAESTRPVVMAAAKPKEEAKRSWPLLLLGAAAMLLLAYGVTSALKPDRADANAFAASANDGAPSDTPTRQAASVGRPDSPTLPALEPAAPAEAADPMAQAEEPAANTPDAPQEPAANTPDAPQEDPTPTPSLARVTEPARPRTPASHPSEPSEHAQRAPATHERAPTPPAAHAPAPAPPAVAPAAAPAPPPRPVVNNREDLPDTPTRGQVQAAFTAVLPNLRACTDAHGAIPVRVTVSGSGRVTTAVVQGTWAGTPEGSCLARAVRTARLPAFRQPRININYPFVL